MGVLTSEPEVSRSLGSRTRNGINGMGNLIFGRGNNRLLLRGSEERACLGQDPGVSEPGASRGWRSGVINLIPGMRQTGC